MANLLEIRDPDEARRFLLESFFVSRLANWSVDQLKDSLRCCVEALTEGNPVPLVGMVTDVMQLVDGATSTGLNRPQRESSGFSSTLTSRYEDQVVGKFFADMSFERGVDAIQKYDGRDRMRATAFLVHQLSLRSNMTGFLMSPAVLKGLIAEKEDVLVEDLAQVQIEQRDLSVARELEDLIHCVRNTGQLLGPEDIFELESGTALSKFGQRIALRQVLQAEEFLRQELPKEKPRGRSRSYAVATNILEEDYYPIGGFTSISNRGTMESLLRSELAYIEDDHRPDVFDIKYVRDELLYYSRDENQFYRRRVCFQFVLDVDLVDSRVKDVGATWQRIIAIMAMVVVAVRSLTEWLSADSLRFEVLLVGRKGKRVLADEYLLLETIFHEEIAAGLLQLVDTSLTDLRSRCEAQARVSLCHCTIFTVGKGMARKALEADSESEGKIPLPLVTVLVCDGPNPQVQIDDEVLSYGEELEPWRSAMRDLVLAWL